MNEISDSKLTTFFLMEVMELTRLSMACLPQRRCSEFNLGRHIYRVIVYPFELANTFGSGTILSCYKTEKGGGAKTHFM